MQNGASVIHASASVEWQTPQWLFDDLNAEFHFDLDVAATKENHKVDRYFTANDNGLQKSWEGHTVWCNPPYGRKQTALWVQKAFCESLKAGTTVVMLIPARTDTKWFHDYINEQHEVRFIRGRLRFGGSDNNAPFPSMIVIMRRK